MCMYPRQKPKKIAISNRHIFWKNTDGVENMDAYVDYLSQLCKNVDILILREKDLDEAAYQSLAGQVLKNCIGGAEVYLHTYLMTACKLCSTGIHLPLPLARNYEKDGLLAVAKKELKEIGISVHSIEEGREAEKLGATYVTYSHVFETDCKKGLPPRGLDALREVCRNLRIPVYALGGITAENENKTFVAGAAGACRMSDYMLYYKEKR